MKTKMKISVLVIAYLIMLPAMFILPLFTIPEYSIIGNTLSDLGAQATPYAWIMNTIFLLLATGSVIAGWTYFDGLILHRIILILFGISLTLSAVFNHPPVDPDIKYNLREAGLHAYFVCTAVFSFTILTLATSFIMERQHERLLAIVTGLSAIILSVLTSELDHLAGIWDRLLFMISFGWMIYNFKTREY